MYDETKIIEKLKNLISDTGEFNTDIPLHQQKEIKEKVVIDVNDFHFECTKTYPLCGVPCDEIHPEQLDLDSQHCSCCVQPIGFARCTSNKEGSFITSTSNDIVKSDHTFRNADTNYVFVHYRNYKTVNDYYNSWNIEL